MANLNNRVEPSWRLNQINREINENERPLAWNIVVIRRIEWIRDSQPEQCGYMNYVAARLEIWRIISLVSRPIMIIQRRKRE